MILRRPNIAEPSRAALLCALLALAPGADLRAQGALPAPAAQTAAPAPDPVNCDPPGRSRAYAGADLWSAQATLIAQCLARLPPRAPSRPNVYALAVAPHGTQHLFAREARVALRAFAANYGGTATTGLLLSNDNADLMHVPLATQENMAQLIREIGGHAPPGPDDILLIYLTSHGGPDAALQSGLPGNLPIRPISAQSLAQALEAAPVRRRVIIISACFAGSWIPALANDDTIVIAAAAADRTSFGCAEDRPLTYFGEAFLTGPFARGASLADSFEGAKKTVSQWEKAENLAFSLPQVSIGKNMRGVWLATPGKAAAPARSAMVAPDSGARRRETPARPARPALAAKAVPAKTVPAKTLPAKIAPTATPPIH